jgi:competence protein ComEC
VASQILFSHPRVSRVRQWDVGQGDAALIQEGGRNEIIDAGPSRIMDASAWIRKLARAGAPRIDALMFSHLDEDHRGGSKMLLSVASVACVLLPLNVQRSDRGRRLASEILEEFPDTKIEEQDCIRLSRVGWFESKRSGSAGNELMAGVVHEMGGGRAYFALGDGDEIQELLYESYFRPELERNSERIWKVGHHGSRFSSNSGFLRRLQPKEAWISVGARNPYHHPAPATLGILRDLSIRFRRTDQEGDLELASTEKRIQGPSSSTFLKWLSK